MPRTSALEKIQRNIDAHGFHLYDVLGGAAPRFSYSIGLNGPVGAEVVLAGGAFFEGNEPGKIIGSICRRLLDDVKIGRRIDDRACEIISVDGLGTFRLRAAHSRAECDESRGRGRQA